MRLAGLLILSCWIMAAPAQEFWVEAEDFTMPANQPFMVNFLTGQHFLGKRVDKKKYALDQVTAYLNEQTIPFTDSVTMGKLHDLVFSLPDSGSVLVSATYAPAFVTHTSDAFNTYLKARNYNDILDMRTSRNLTGKGAKEGVLRFAKVLLRSGESYEAPERVLGHPIEIVPVSNPYDPDVRYFTGKVLMQDQSASHLPVNIWTRVGNASYAQPTHTESDGTFRFPVQAGASYLISVDKMVVSADRSAHFKSLWCTLAFATTR